MKTGQGKILMDGIRSVLAHMKEDGLKQLAKRSEAASQGITRMHLLLLVFAIPSTTSESHREHTPAEAEQRYYAILDEPTIAA